MVGVVATAISASKSGSRAQKILEDANYVHHPNKVKDVIGEAKLVWKEYLITTGITALTIGSIIATKKLTKREMAALAMLGSASTKLLNDYKAAIRDVVPEKYEDVVKKAAEYRKNGIQIADPPPMVASGIFSSSIDQPYPGEDEILFYDDFFDVSFRSSLANVRTAQYHLNRNFILGGEVTMSEFYGFLGIDPPKDIPDSGLSEYSFDEIGWGQDFLDGGCIWIDFETVYTVPDDGGEPYYILDYVFPPEYLYPF